MEKYMLVEGVCCPSCSIVIVERVFFCCCWSASKRMLG
jgi:hypothetical protein